MCSGPGKLHRCLIAVAGPWSLPGSPPGLGRRALPSVPPGAQASGPQDPRLGLRKFSLSPPWKGSFSMEELYKSTIENDPFHGGLNGNSWSLARARTVALVSTFREISARRPDSRPSRALAPALPAGASRPATDDVPRTGTSDRGRRLRTWESGPGARASGPQDPGLGLRNFSASARMRGVGPSRALEPMHGAPRPATDDRRPPEDRDL